MNCTFFRKKHVLHGFIAFVIFETLKFLLYQFETFAPIFNGIGEISKGDLPKENLKEGFPVFCLVICQSTPDDIAGGKRISEEANTPNRQLSQAVTLIKSAVSLTNLSYLNFIVTVDEKHIYENLLEELGRWPEHVRKKLVFQRREVWYPPTRHYFRALFRVCATERLFFPDHFTDVDSLIYLDTDVVFMSPPEQLWNQFQLFKSHHISGISPCRYYYNKYFKFPHYGESGLNVGVWMMNLTRMRTFPGGWVKGCIKTYGLYGKKLNLPTQDVTNIMFAKYPDKLYKIGCEWNYRYKLCSKTESLGCKLGDKGVHLLHGVDLSFYNDNDQIFVKLYEAWSDYEVGRPLTELLSTLRRYLAEANEGNERRGCSSLNDTDFIFTKELENRINNSY